MTETPQTIDPAELPQTITSYLKAHQARDLDVAMQSYEPGAAVTDEGRTYNGHAEIRAWLSRSAGERRRARDEIYLMCDADVVRRARGARPGRVARRRIGHGRSDADRPVGRAGLKVRLR